MAFVEIDKYTPPKIIPNSPQKIPRIIFQTHETNLLPERMVRNIYTWINKNPNYEYRFFDKHDRITFINEHFDKSVLEAYHKLNHGSLKADLFRACFIYINGGVYSDIDQTCIQPLDNVIDPEDDLVTGIERNTPHQMLIIASPKIPIFKHLIDEGCQRVFKDKPLLGPWAGRGAGFLGPPAYTYSWIWFHNEKQNPIVDKSSSANWLFRNQLKKGKYVLCGFSFNVKNYSLFKENKNGNEHSIAVMKYKGYGEDNNMLKIAHWSKTK